MTDRKLMQMALDVLKKLNKDGWILADFEDEVYASIEALRARLAQPEPDSDIQAALKSDNWAVQAVGMAALQKKYTAPAQREWVGLTDEERTFLAWESNNGPECVAMTEAKLKEKNNE